MIMRADLRQLLIDPFCLLLQGSSQLSYRIFGNIRRLGINDIDHRLRLCQSHSPIQERTFREFSRAGLTNAQTTDGIHCLPKNRRRTMTLQFCRVFSGIRSGAMTDGAKAQIHDLSI